jgi:hypothetical protein
MPGIREFGCAGVLAGIGTFRLAAALPARAEATPPTPGHVAILTGMLKQTGTTRIHQFDDRYGKARRSTEGGTEGDPGTGTNTGDNGHDTDT